MLWNFQENIDMGYKKKTSMAVIRVDRTASFPTQLSEFLQAIFYRKLTNREYAEKIINAIIDQKDLEALRETEGISISSYYEILRRLKALGLIKKVKGSYIISEMFSLRISELSTYWKGIVDKYNKLKPKIEPIKDEPITEDEEL